MERDRSSEEESRQQAGGHQGSEKAGGIGSPAEPGNDGSWAHRGAEAESPYAVAMNGGLLETIPLCAGSAFGRSYSVQYKLDCGAAMKVLLVFLGLTLSALPSFAEDHTQLIGVWQLLSFQTEFKDGSPRQATFGEHPLGYIVFTKEGRMMAVIEAEGRKDASTNQDRAALLMSLGAYSGKYQVTGDQWTTNVDVAWIPAWRGTKQVRSYALIGDRLTVTSMWQPSLSIAGSPMTRGILVFARVK
jgi:hypothetical protein